MFEKMLVFYKIYLSIFIYIIILSIWSHKLLKYASELFFFCI